MVVACDTQWCTVLHQEGCTTFFSKHGRLFMHHRLNTRFLAFHSMQRWDEVSPMFLAGLYGTSSAFVPLVTNFDSNSKGSRRLHAWLLRYSSAKAIGTSSSRPEEFLKFSTIAQVAVSQFFLALSDIVIEQRYFMMNIEEYGQPHREISSLYEFVECCPSSQWCAFIWNFSHRSWW